MNQLSFINLLREIISLAREGRSISGRVRPNLSLVLREALSVRIPKQGERLELSKIEFLFLATVAIEGNPCRDAISQFARYWSESEEERMVCEFQIRASIKQGKLTDFISADRDGYVVKPERQELVLLAILDEKLSLDGLCK